MLLLPPQPFYGPFSGTTRVSRCQKRTSDFMVQGKINRGRHTDHPAGRHSIRNNQCPLPPSPIFTGRMPFLPPSQQCQSTDGTDMLLLPLRNHTKSKHSKTSSSNLDKKFSIFRNVKQCSSLHIQKDIHHSLNTCFRSDKCRTLAICKCGEISHFKLQRFSADGIVKARENVVWEVFTIIQICKILNELVQRHLLSRILQTQQVR